MKQNICVIGLNNDYVANIGKAIADAFEMYFADITELIKFELMDVEYARALCGEDYIHKVERSKVKAVSGFENTLFTMDYSLLNDEVNYEKTKHNAYVIYLKLGKVELEKLVDSMKNPSPLIYDVYEFRNNLCEKYSDFMIECDGKNVKRIIKEVSDKFLQLD